MRSRFVPILLVTLVLGVVLAAVSYYQPWKKWTGSGHEMDSSMGQGMEMSGDSQSRPGEMMAQSGKRTNPNPDLTVDEQGMSKATVVIETNKGTIKYKFYPNDAPKTVSRIVELINSGFYDGLIFHRVIPGFVIQGGDPRGDGTGGSGQNLPAEFNSRKHIEGTVAMARAADPDSADSQFYITHAPQKHLDNNYTVFGQVIEGMDVVRAIRAGDKMTNVYVE